jgi:cytochrome c oxidase cbb3-type subunit 4
MISGIISLILLILFIIGSIWVYSPNRKAEFDEAASLAVDDNSEKL